MPARRHPLEPIVKVAIANNPTWGATRIYNHLVEEGARARLTREELFEQLPDPRTISRWKAEITEEERRQLQYVEWPTTFDSGVLPWESAPMVLAEMAHERMERRRLLVVEARRYWQIRRSMPISTPEHHLRIAGILAQRLALEDLFDGPSESLLAAVQARVEFLALSGAVGAEWADAAYWGLRRTGRIPGFPEVVVPADATIEQFSAAMSIVTGMRYGVMPGPGGLPRNLDAAELNEHFDVG